MITRKRKRNPQSSMTSPCSPLCAPVSGFGQLGGIVVPIEDFKRCWANVREGYGNSKNTGDMGFLSGWQGRNVCRLKGVCCFCNLPWKTPTGKAVREIWFEYFWKRRSKEWCWIFESGRILEEMRRVCEYLVRRERWGAKMRKSVLGFILKKLY